MAYADHDRWYIPDWVEDLGDKMDSIIETLKDLISGKLLFDAIHNFVVMLVDEGLAPLYNVFAKSYLFSPRVAEIDAVHTAWSFFTIVGLVGLFIGSLILAQQVIKGKKELKGILKIFIICFVAAFLSLTIINIINVAVNWITQLMLENMLKTENIDYQHLGGQEIVKAMVVGRHALTDQAMMAKTAGQLIADSEGGLSTLFIVSLVVILPLYLVSALKVLLLIVLAIFVALWITGAAFSGKLEVLVGYANLYIRTLLVGLLLALHWGIFVKSQSSYGTGVGFAYSIGISPTYLACLSVILLLFLLYFFWIKPILAAVRDPITLGGGKVVEQLGDWGEKTSERLNGIGKRLGSEDIQQRSLDLKRNSQRLAEYGRRMQEGQKQLLTSKMLSKATGGISEELQGIRYEEPQVRAQETGTMAQVTLQPSEFAFRNSSSSEIKQTLSKQGFANASKLSMRAEDRMAANEIVQRMQQNGALKPYLHWNSNQGELMVTGDDSVLRKVISGFDNAKLSVAATAYGMTNEGVFVDVQSGMVQTLGESARTQKTMEQMQHADHLYSKVKMTADEAKAAMSILQHETAKPWVTKVIQNNGELWIPTDAYEEAIHMIGPMLKRQVMRIDMPEGSRFLPDLLANIKQTNASLHEALSADTAKNTVLVREDQVSAFHASFNAFRKDRVPYWRTSSGQIKVIIDGVPVDYGGVPHNGMDMGSFEKLQTQAMRKSKKDETTKEKAS